MSAEFYIVFDDPVWYEQNQPIVRKLIESLGTFTKNIGDEEYWLRGSEEGGDWAFGARIFMRQRDMLLEISSHPPSIVADIKKLSGLIAAHAKSHVVDDDGERMDCYSHSDNGHCHLE